ncbi:GYDIA family GHMP kinase [Wenyingzhuangia sp. IMCC45467]
MQQFYSHGKLLISGEYLVLDGAISLALPTKYGQFLEVVNVNTKTILWESYNVAQECWFKAEFDVDNFNIINSLTLKNDNDKIARTLQDILKTAKNINPDFLKNSDGLKVKTALTFPNHWGLGTSSTLINNIAAWANINAFELLEKSFGGSGYDIACAQNNQAITYQRNGIYPDVKQIDFNPSFKNELFFVYLNQKQDSKEGIKMYRSLTIDKQQYIKEINNLTNRLIKAISINEFSNLLHEHETFLAGILKVTSVKQKLFADFNGAVKSLGAWGGDFVLVTGTEKYVKDYFTNKNYNTIISYNDMILS